jgi:hypothetical protein
VGKTKIYDAENPWYPQEIEEVREPDAMERAQELANKRGEEVNVLDKEDDSFIVVEPDPDDDE